jgi:hypothetical protein
MLTAARMWLAYSLPLNHMKCGRATEPRQAHSRSAARAERSRRVAPADLREALVGPLERVQVGGVVEV